MREDDVIVLADYIQVAEFIIPGQPIGQPRVTRWKGKTFVPSEHPVHGYREAARLCARNALRGYVPPEKALWNVSAFFYFEAKEAQRGYPYLKKPDLDNCVKALLDALNGVLWKDDAQVCELATIKRYSKDGPGYTKVVACVMKKPDEA